MRGNKLALWAGISAFFATLLAIGTIDIFNPTDDVRLLSGIVVGLITAGAVYSKQRLDDEKNARILGGKIVVNEIGDKKIFSLELDEDPDVLEQGHEVIFKVEKGSSE